MKLLFYNDIIPLLPQEEKYQLSAQIRDTAASITTNIAEGYGRYHYKESMHFYRISRGSLSEIKDYLISCYDFKFINKELFDQIEIEITEGLKLLNGYIRYTKNQIQSPSK